MDACLGLSFIMLIVFFVKVLPAILEWKAEDDAKQADQKLMLENPAAWRAKEEIKLQKQRHEAEAKRAAEQQAIDNKASLVWGLGRGLGWW